MGQRSQVIINTPAVFYNENNRNNRRRHLIVFHNQWLYGCRFINHTARIIDAIDKLMKREQNRFHTGFQEKIYFDAVNHANYFDILDLCETNLEDTDYKKDYLIYNVMLSCVSVKDFLNRFDNNNGYIYIEVTDNNHIQYGFLNGLEDAKTIEPRTVREYIGLFYNQNEMEERNQYYSEALSILGKHTFVNPLKSLQNFKNTLWLIKNLL